MTESNTPAPLLRSLDLMSRDTTALLVIDVQERLLSAQPRADEIVSNCGRLAEAATALGLSVATTVQAPEKLGSVVDSLSGVLREPIAKTRFSACVDGSLLDAWRGRGIRQVLLAGIETHVCVAQTALDLVAQGFATLVCVDAIGSRFEADHEIALRRMESSGVMATTTEAAIFEWCESADDPAFRTISALAKRSKP